MKLIDKLREDIFNSLKEYIKKNGSIKINEFELKTNDSFIYTETPISIYMDNSTLMLKAFSNEDETFYEDLLELYSLSEITQILENINIELINIKN